MDTVTAILHRADWEPPCIQGFKSSMEKCIQKCCNCLGEVGGEGGREGKNGEGRKYIRIILHVPMVLAYIDIRLP